MEPWVSKGIKEKHVATRVGLVRSRLYPSESLIALFACQNLRGTCDFAAITDRRLLGVVNSKADPLREEVDLSRIASFELSAGRFGKTSLTVMRDDGEQVKLGTVEKDDVETIRGLLDNVIGDRDVAASDDAEEDGEFDALRPLVVGKAGKSQLREIKRQCRRGELPLFVIADGASGALAAFEDRCMIVKKGALTSLMTGALGGGRVAIFPYHQVTGVEYNGGLVQGVLEILTASYQGSANKDYWRGSNRGRNADSNDPFTLSNTLPLSRAIYKRARPKVEALQDMVARAHRGDVRAPASGTPSLSDELAKLSDLKDRGVLTDQEFDLAKARLLASD